MLVRKEPHSYGSLMKSRSMDYEGPNQSCSVPLWKHSPTAVLLLNLHPTSTQDAKRLEGLPRKGSSVCRKAE
jgi:hypothetical protein